MQTRLFIGGKWIGTAATLPVRNPFTGEEIARVSLGDAHAIDSAIAAAHAAFSQTRSVPAHERASLLARIAQAIEMRREEFAEMIVAESGKPITLAEGEVARAVCTFATAAEEARRWSGAWR